MHIHVYVHTRVNIYIYTYMHKHIHTYMHAYAQTQLYLHTYTIPCRRTHSCQQTYIETRIRASNIHTYVLTYIHTLVGKKFEVFRAIKS